MSGFQLRERYSAPYVIGLISIFLIFAIYLGSAIRSAFREMVYWCSRFVIVSWIERPTMTLLILLAAVLGCSILFRLIRLTFREWHGIRMLTRWVSVRRDVEKEKILQQRYPDIGCWVIRDERPIAVTYGLFQQHILVTSALMTLVSPAELGSILSHEAGHVKHHHPAKRLLWSYLKEAFFFLPLLRDAAQAMIDLQEYTADTYAITRHGSSASLLKSGLSKLIRFALGSPIATGCQFTATYRRLSWLAQGSNVTPRLAISLRSILITSAVSILLLTVSFPSARAVANHTAGTTSYCELAELLSPDDAIQSKLPAGFVRINYTPVQ
ncbi:MAG: M56 family metallopeptidase [Patescibacteria group bacterium]